MDENPQLNEETKETLKRIHKELELDDAVEEDINWEDIKPMPVDPVELILERVNSLKERIYKTFRKSKAAVQEIIPGRQRAKCGQEFLFLRCANPTFWKPFINLTWLGPLHHIIVNNLTLTGPNPTLSKAVRTFKKLLKSDAKPWKVMKSHSHKEMLKTVVKYF